MFLPLFRCYPLHHTTRIFLSWLFVKAVLVLFLILYGKVGLGPDEAQYWTWSQALDWGYYSKPPGIAWQIWLGTQLFGQTELGVRALAVVLSFFQAVFVYQLSLQVGLQRVTAFWCGIAMAFCPIGILGSFFAITDSGMLLFWTMASLHVASSLQRNIAPNPIKIGIYIALGALFKWPIYLFWIFFIFIQKKYFLLQKISLFCVGVFISLVGLLPSIWWNRAHDWATFQHVFATIQGGSGPHHNTSGNFFDFLGAQMALLSPVLFILLLYSFWICWQQRKVLPSSLFFCISTTFTILSVGLLVSCFQKVQGNWVIFAYPTAFPIIGWGIFENLQTKKNWLKIGLMCSLLPLGFLFGWTFVSASPQLSAYGHLYLRNPLKHNIGWEPLKQILQEQGYQSDQHFLASDKYQTTSILSFYSEKQKRAYFLNLQGARRNQFSYWPSLQEKEQTGYFVWIENISPLHPEWQIKQNFYESVLPAYFEKVEPLGSFALIMEKGDIVKTASIFRCEKYKSVASDTIILY